MAKKAAELPYPFVLDHLIGINLVIKPMFGCYAIYANGQLKLFMMKRDKPLEPSPKVKLENGIYVATMTPHVESLRPIFPNAEFQILKDDKIWIYFAESAKEFEEYAVTACEMIAAKDKRIGR